MLRCGIVQLRDGITGRSIYVDPEVPAVRILVSCVLAILAVVLLFTNPGQGQNSPSPSPAWKTQINRDIVAPHMGWSVDIPAYWVSVPDIQPAWPLGAGYRDHSGTSGFFIVLLDNCPADEQKGLSERGYVLGSTRIGGHPAVTYTRVTGQVVEQSNYVTIGDDTYRITMFCPVAVRATFERIYRSFTFVRNSQDSAAIKSWTSFVNEHLGYEFSHPSDCTVKSMGVFASLSKNGKIVAKVSPVESQPDNGQSFRGFARSVGKTAIPGAQTLAKFAPYTIGSLTAYEAIWQTEDNQYYGPVVYIPLNNAQGYRALQIVLLDTQFMDDFFKLVNSTKIRYTQNSCH